MNSFFIAIGVLCTAIVVFIILALVIDILFCLVNNGGRARDKISELEKEVAILKKQLRDINGGK